ncbi:hypothetical protein N483_24675 [Pseudoalteromonas luteoviolacea NCIMB 1944]|uniref:Uncharacterized protein n=1 Tax=Pseudoalteromonas luteoviolacea (strain 2ta16) TaxID=1353533 RepID=V4J7J1_PSEL2|nr:hypothetical protein PL2TA16_00932 [Pseudoalteromonas luteoviolacea 2ta16]KZN34819.1 hypothetical protein N483_24675 [Pseudoalteromonas luteoviolacea NCIMB 1944]
MNCRQVLGVNIHLLNAGWISQASFDFSNWRHLDLLQQLTTPLEYYDRKYTVIVPFDLDSSLSICKQRLAKVF